MPHKCESPSSTSSRAVRELMLALLACSDRLEDLALGHSRQAIVNKTTATPSSATGSSPQAGTNPLYPSLLTYPAYSDLKRTVLDLLLSRMPQDRDLRASLDVYIQELSWAWPITCEPQLRSELDEFILLRRQNRAHLVDPAWLALIFMIVAMAGSAAQDLLEPDARMSEFECQALFDQYFDASRLCLDFANWFSVRNFFGCKDLSLLHV